MVMRNRLVYVEATDMFIPGTFDMYQGGAAIMMGISGVLDRAPLVSPYGSFIFWRRGVTRDTRASTQQAFWNLTTANDPTAGPALP